MTLEGLDHQFALSEARVAGLLQNSETETLHRPPGPARWSALQCIEHLSLANTLNAASLQAALSRMQSPPLPATDTVRPGFVWRILLRGVDPSTRLRGFAPSKLRPAARLDPVETQRRFLHTHSIRHLMSRCGALDINRIRFMHPAIYIPISAGTMFWLLALHESRHLQQAERAIQGD